MERREHARTRIWIPIEVTAPGVPPFYGVSRDLSRSGVLLSSAQGLGADTPISVKLTIPADKPLDRTVTGRVVRSGPNEDDPDGLWPIRIAIVFDEPIVEVDGLLDEVVASVRRL